MAMSNRLFNTTSKIKIPKRIGVLGYGALGKCIVEVILHHHPQAQIVVLDQFDLDRSESRFKYINNKVTKENIKETLKIMDLNEGDILIDVSTNINFLDIFPLCSSHGVMYSNSAMEVWMDDEDAVSYPKSADELYRGSLGYTRDMLEQTQYWKRRKGATAIFENGMNPGMISQCVKKGLDDAAEYFLNDTSAIDIDKVQLKERLEEKNHSKIAQILGVHTIHCSETDNQVIKTHPKDIKTKFYNTWSCRGFFQEGMIPIQVARGSHEDTKFDEFKLFRNDTLLMSWKPSVQTWAKSWVPRQDTKGVLIPHGEAYSIQDYLRDPVTGYAPSQYYVYDFTPYAKEFIRNMPKDATLENLNPQSEVMHPMNHPELRGHDKVGALLIMKNNRGWWAGSVMDDIDSNKLFGGKFGPTVLQVISGVYGGFLWQCQHPNLGCIYPESIDTDFMIKNTKHLMGRFVSTHVDLSKTHLKDCHKLQSFLCEQPDLELKH